MATRTYTVTATRSDGWWVLEAPEVPGAVSQVRRLDQAQDMAREAIALLLDLPEEGIEVRIEPRLDDEVREVVDRARESREEVAVVQLKARDAVLAAVQQLRARGLSVRDIGELLGVSHQRAAKLDHEARARSH